MAARIGIDTGGTFTDVVRWSKQGVQVHKVASTKHDPGLAVLQGLAGVRRTPSETVDIVHGTTVGLNAVLQGRLPRTVFVTNQGFRDLIEIGRQERTDLYALEPDRPMPPVPRELRVEVDCRRGPYGKVETALTRQAIERTVRRVMRLRPATIAIGLLHSPAAPADEQRLAKALRKALPGIAVTCSAELLPAFGEYERFSAAILNAAITPLVGTYTTQLNAALGNGQLRLLRSSLGILPPKEAALFPARAMFSGPAGGVLAVARLCKAAAMPHAAALDMGGTSTDVCFVHEGELRTDQSVIQGLPLPLPSVAVHTIGCGGGSIAYRDAGGALRVGPGSAGADPGPACYGKGEDPTVTDAHMALGHMGPDTLLGGSFPVDVDRSVRAMERLGKQLGLSPARTALGILAVADVHMVRALMVTTVERSVDPATVPLIAYGGAGGLHAASLAIQLGMPFALVPAHPGAFSALGLALAGESTELVEGLRITLTKATERALRQRALALGKRARRELGLGLRPRVSVEIVIRFQGQGNGLRLPLTSRTLAAQFLAAHQARFGFIPEDGAIEVIQLVARAETNGQPLPRATFAQNSARPKAKLRRAPLGRQSVRVFRREELGKDTCLIGPCVIEEPTAVTRVPARCQVSATTLGLKVIRARV
ncbi:N-methylhydantoinase A [Planctomycetota bacterium]|nr:N-methylhydantoinase A [Planctomycetota bacterium]